MYMYTYMYIKILTRLKLNSILKNANMLKDKNNLYSLLCYLSCTTCTCIMYNTHFQFYTVHAYATNLHVIDTHFSWSVFFTCTHVRVQYNLLLWTL